MQKSTKITSFLFQKVGKIIWNIKPQNENCGIRKEVQEALFPVCTQVGVYTRTVSYANYLI